MICKCHGYSIGKFHSKKGYKFLQTLCYAMFYLTLIFNVTNLEHKTLKYIDTWIKEAKTNTTPSIQ
jgi:hypothetical protein